MRELLYYPGFEVRSEDWLKFALLYLDKLHSIIPETANPYLSGMYQRLRGETDLIEADIPEYDEGVIATLDAIELIQKMLENPKLYGKVIGDPNFHENWRCSENQNYTLFRAKYTPDWKDFCVGESLGVKEGEGMRLPRSLGLIYMSFLAHAISEGREREVITDYEDMDEISILTRKTSPSTQNSTTMARETIELKIPKNISELDMKKVIAHRESPGFKDRLHAFHNELDDHIKLLEAGETDESFLESRGSIFSEFSDEIVKLGVGVTGFSLGVWLIISKSVDPAVYYKGLAVGAGLAAGSVISIRNTWNNTKSKRLTRKYLSKIKKL